MTTADKAHELYVELLPVLSKVLNHGSPCSKVHYPDNGMDFFKFLYFIK